MDHRWMVHMVSAGRGGGGEGVRSDNLQDFDPLGGEVGSFDFLMINNSLSTGLPHNGSSLWPLLT